MALMIGMLFVFLLGIIRHIALRLLDRLAGKDIVRPNLTIVAIFLGLGVIHTGEILLFADAYALLLQWPEIGRLTGDFDGGWEAIVYFSGINFMTLGYTQIETEGPIRLISMMESLGGFMVLTWSATFIYSAWSRAFR
jgi:xanthine/uracil permease